MVSTMSATCKKRFETTRIAYSTHLVVGCVVVAHLPMVSTMFTLLGMACLAAVARSSIVFPSRIELDEMANYFPKVELKRFKKDNVVQFESNGYFPDKYLPRYTYMTLYSAERGSYAWNQIEIRFRAGGDCSGLEFYVEGGSSNRKRLDNTRYPFNTIDIESNGYITIKYLTKKIHEIYPPNAFLLLSIPATCHLAVDSAKREYIAPADFLKLTVAEEARQGYSSLFVSLFSRKVYVKKL